MKPCGVITLAMGPKVYWQMAINLARSIRLWHAPRELAITIVTDRRDKLPPDLCGIEIKQLHSGELGIGFETKLHLDTLAPAEKTLFIDADCLVYSRLETLFQRAEGHPVATFGTSISEGEWFGDVKHLCATLGVSSIPKFNGGLYYLERGPASTEVYESARKLKSRYDELGLVRLRGRPNDELLVASAMALHGLPAIEDDGRYLSDPLSCQAPMSLNVLTGRRRLRNPPPPSHLHQAWYPFADVSPSIVHFLGEHVSRYPYRTEAMRLRLGALGLPHNAATLFATSAVQFPGWFASTIKRGVRPIYRQIFGTRRIAKTPRLEPDTARG
jgi:hypothetical protein